MLRIFGELALASGQGNNAVSWYSRYQEVSFSKNLVPGESNFTEQVMQNILTETTVLRFWLIGNFASVTGHRLKYTQIHL